MKEYVCSVCIRPCRMIMKDCITDPRSCLYSNHHSSKWEYVPDLTPEGSLLGSLRKDGLEYTANAFEIYFRAKGLIE